MKILRIASVALIFFAPILISACSSNKTLPPATTYPSLTTDISDYQYLIGPGDNLQIFVWRNPDVSGSFIVRPDGKITSSLVEDIQVSGKTPATLAREIEKSLSTYIRDPKVTVSVTRFSGPFSEQVRVIGEATEPKAVNYQEQMTMLDLMVAVGGLKEFADGNGAKLIRVIDGQQQQFNVKLDDLIRDGDIKANIDILPGDILIIPEAWY